MSTDTARWIEALDRQATIVMAIFARAGFEPISPPIIQPADVFLDLIGEELRGRTYVFSDPDGAELCLRPDLTVPACRHYVAAHGGGGGLARYAYNGVIFRHQEAAADVARLREFRQAGIESFAAADTARADAECAALIVEAVRASGLRAFRLRLGDIGLIHALLAAIDMPERWRLQLEHHFWRPGAFRRHLRRLSRPVEEAARALPAPLLARLDPDRPEAAEATVAEYLDGAGLAVTGTRTIAEIAEHLVGVAADARARPLPAATAALLEEYLAIDAPASEATGRISRLLAPHKLDIGAALEAFDHRLSLIAREGVDVAAAEFVGGFGRSFQYYTGFVFEIGSPALQDWAAVAGGGRYDGLVGAVRSGASVPAVGAAIHTERLLLAVRGGRP